uniref:Uncharacterized protein n=1 Tax=Candidatus Kentrum sp. TC TaxID=2126339 RepID=A0A450ZTY6_9GAMM|nr:MAG: hypothetical protein BECKTC1821F_GA0114240_101550 [Candidatus Kentron sp. TC]
MQCCPSCITKTSVRQIPLRERVRRTNERLRLTSEGLAHADIYPAPLFGTADLEAAIAAHGLAKNAKLTARSA